MSIDLIHDAEKGITALIDAENGRALGPLLAGEKDTVGKMFDAFVGALDTDVSKMHPADLDHHFRGFISALADDVEDAAGAAVEGAVAGTGTTEGPGVAAGVTPPAAAEQRASEAAAPGETGGIAGSPTGTEQAPAGVEGGAAPAGTPPAADSAGKVADGGLPTGIEQAPAGAEGTPGEAATPAGSEGGGIPKVAGA